MTYAFELFGIAVFAATGCLAGGKKQMDIFGVMVVGTVTALGGGTLRDLFLNVPVVWVEHNTYLFSAFGAVLLTFAWVRRRPAPQQLLNVLDALGLALFSVLGAQKALDLGTTGFIAILMGGMTGVAGGVIRDLLCNEMPKILYERELVATPALTGATVYVLATTTTDRPLASMVAGFGVALAFRLIAIKWKLGLPKFVDAYADPKPPSR